MKTVRLYEYDNFRIPTYSDVAFLNVIRGSGFQIPETPDVTLILRK